VGDHAEPLPHEPAAGETRLEPRALHHLHLAGFNGADSDAEATGLGQPQRERAVSRGLDPAGDPPDLLGRDLHAECAHVLPHDAVQRHRVEARLGVDVPDDGARARTVAKVPPARLLGGEGDLEGDVPRRRASRRLTRPGRRG
jgi:hypothetical protein